MKKLFLLVLGSPFFLNAQTNFSLDTVFHIGTSVDENIREIALLPDGDIVATGYPAPSLIELQSIFGSSRVIEHGPGPSTAITTRGGGTYTTPNQNTFVVRISGDLRTLRWIAVIGGTDFDRGYGIDVDPMGNIYVGGMTASLDFPVTSEALDESNNGGSDTSIDNHHGTSTDMFALKLDGNGNLLHSTYVGSSAGDGSRGGIEVDDIGNVYLVGYTGIHYSNRFDRTNSRIVQDDFLNDASNIANSAKLDTLFRDAGNFTTGVIVKLNSTFDQVIWSRFLGASNDIGDLGETVVGVRLSNNRLYFNAIARGPGARVTDGSTFNANGDVLYGVLDANDGGILAMSYLGGPLADDVKRRGALDSDDNFYMCVQTEGNSFAGQNLNNNSTYKAVLVKTSFNAATSQMQLEWANIVDQSYETSLHGPAIDHQNNVYVGGLIYGQLPSNWFLGAIDNTYDANEDVYMSVFDPSGNRLYTTYISGSGDDKPRFITLDALDNPILGINSTSSNFPSVDSNLQPPGGNAGNKDLHFTRILNTDCRIVSLRPVNGQGVCDPGTGMFTQDIEVKIANRVGDLIINGQTFVGINDWDTVTLVLQADGQVVDLSAQFIGNSSCNYSLTEALTAPTSCSTSPTCNIDDIEAGTPSSCDPSTDRYSVDVTVIYSNAPTTGNLVVNNQNFSIGSSPQTVTLVNLPADGNAVDITASFSDDGGCSSTSNGLFTAPSRCSTSPSCSIEDIEAGTPSSCDSSTDTYSVDVTVTYSNAPTTGILVVNNQNFSISSSPQTVTLVNLPADGNAVDITASFSDDSGCTNTASGLIIAPTSCSTPPSCSIDNIAAGTPSSCDPSTDTYSVEVTVTYSNAPTTGNLVVNNQNFSIGGSPQTVTLANLPADGNTVDVTASFSVDGGCSNTANGLIIAPTSCSTPPSCSIDNITAGTPSPCDPSTDTYSVEVTVTYSNAPTTGNLVVNNQNFSIGSSPQTVTLVNLLADGNSVDITANFSDDSGCSNTVSGLIIAPTSCSTPPSCSIDDIETGTPSPCDPSTDTYSVDVTVTYSNAPTTGNLVVNNQNFSIGSSPQTVTLANLPADGNSVDITANFSDDSGCSNTVSGLISTPSSCSTPPLGFEEDKIQVQNPIGNSFFIQSSISLIWIQLFDMQGKLIYQNLNQNKEKINVDSSGFENGIYVLHFQDEEGNLYTRKLIKQ